MYKHFNFDDVLLIHLFFIFLLVVQRGVAETESMSESIHHSLREKWKCYLLSCVWLFVTPWTLARQAPLFMEFSRQEHRSGLPCPLPGDLPNPEIEPRSSTLQVDSLPSEPPGKPKNTGVGTLYLLQGIFQTQKSNQGLPHWGWILYQLSYQGNQTITRTVP